MNAAENVVPLVALALAPASIMGDDALDLAWYFRNGGTDVFAVSTCGVQWERAAMFSRSWTPCERCGGDRQSGRSGLGFVASKPKGRVPTAHEAELLRLLDLYADELPPAADTECPACHGRGCLIDQKANNARGPLTARPTGSSVKSKMGDAVEFDGSDLVRLGRVTRLLAEVGERDGKAAQVIAAYYGPEWTPITDPESEAEAPRKRERGGIAGLFGVWPLTSAGRTLCHAAKGLHPFAALHNANAAQRAVPDIRRGLLLKACDDQARELYATACRVWNGCARTRRSRPVSQ